MELVNNSRKELLTKCEGYGITNCKSKNKSELILLINNAIANDTANANDNTANKNPLKPLIKWSGGKMDEIKMFDNHLFMKFVPKSFSIIFICNP